MRMNLDGEWLGVWCKAWEKDEVRAPLAQQLPRQWEGPGMGGALLGKTLGLGR